MVIRMLWMEMRREKRGRKKEVMTSKVAKSIVKKLIDIILNFTKKSDERFIQICLAKDAMFGDSKSAIITLILIYSRYDFYLLTTYP